MTAAQLSNPLKVALKEWDVVCAALAEGRQIILLRKGGIYESAGEFEVEHRQFLLFPTFLHQNVAMLKAEFQAGIKALSVEPAEISLGVAGQITDIIPMPSRSMIDAIDEAHIFARPLIEMRFNYRPENPLFLLLIRAWRLEAPVLIGNTPGYAGCKSWVPLDEAIETTGARAVIAEGEYQGRREALLVRLRGV